MPSVPMTRAMPATISTGTAWNSCTRSVPGSGKCGVITLLIRISSTIAT